MYNIIVSLLRFSFLVQYKFNLKLFFFYYSIERIQKKEFRFKNIENVDDYELFFFFVLTS